MRAELLLGTALLSTAMIGTAAAQSCPPGVAPTSWVCQTPLSGTAAQQSDISLSYRASLGAAGQGPLSVQQILNSLTSAQVVNALGYTPAQGGSGGSFNNITLTGTTTNTGTITGGDLTAVTLEGTIAVGTTASPNVTLNAPAMVFTGLTTAIPPILTANVLGLSGTIGNGGAVRAPSWTGQYYHIENDSVVLNNAHIPTGFEWRWEMGASGTAQGGRSLATFQMNTQGPVALDASGHTPGIGALATVVDISSTLGGTGIGVGSASGNVYAFHPEISLSGGAKDLQEVDPFGEGDLFTPTSYYPVTISGFSSGGDSQTLEVTSTYLTLSAVPVVVPVLATDPLSVIVSNFCAAINSNATLGAALVAAGCPGANSSGTADIFNLDFPADADMTLTPVGSVGATETLSIGTLFIGSSMQYREEQTFAPAGGAQGVFADTLWRIGIPGSAYQPPTSGFRNLMSIGSAPTTPDDTTAIVASGWPLYYSADWFIAGFQTHYAGNKDAPIIPPRSHSIFNLSNVDFLESIGGPFILPGYELYGDGSQQIGSATIQRLVGNAGTAGIQISANGWEGTAVTVNTAGGASSITNGSCRYYVNNDILTDPWGGHYMVTSTTSLGGLGTIAVVSDGTRSGYPSAPAGAEPPGFYTLPYSDGSGCGGILAYTWTAANTIKIGGSGQTVDIIGGTLDPSTNVSNATVTPPATGGVARSLGTISLDAVNIVDFGADPTGAADSAPACNKAAVAVSRPATVTMPTGKYLFLEPCIIGNTLFAQGLVGPPDNSAIILTNPSFTPGATVTGSIATTTLTVSGITSGTIYPGETITNGASAYTMVLSQISGTTGGIGAYAVNISQTVGSGTLTLSPAGQVVLVSAGTVAPATVQNVHFIATQGASITARASFEALGTCTATATIGCEYPPAIYAYADGFVKVLDNQFDAQWQAFSFLGTAGAGSPCPTVTGNNVGAISIGFTIDQCFNFGHIGNNTYYSYGFSSTTNTNVWLDGNTFADQYGRMDGTDVEGENVYGGRIQMQADFTWLRMARIKLDSEADIELNGVSGGVPTTISDLYQTGTVAASGLCAVNVSGGNSWQFENVSIGNTLSTGAVCITGTSTAQVMITGGNILKPSGYPSINATNTTASAISVYGVTFTGGSSSSSIPVVQMGSLDTISFVGNTLATSASYAAFAGLVDSALNDVQANQFNGWTFTAPGTLGSYQSKLVATSLLIGGAFSVTQSGAGTLLQNTTSNNPLFQFSNNVGTADFLIEQGSTAAVANQVTIKAEPTGTAPVIKATGSDANISLLLGVTGYGEVQISAPLAITGGGVPTAPTCEGTGTIHGFNSLFSVTGGISTATSCTVQFGTVNSSGTTWAATPVCVVTEPGGTAVTGTASWVTTTGSIVITTPTTDTGAVFNVVCGGTT